VARFLPSIWWMWNNSVPSTESGCTVCRNYLQLDWALKSAHTSVYVFTSSVLSLCFARCCQSSSCSQPYVTHTHTQNVCKEFWYFRLKYLWQDTSRTAYHSGTSILTCVLSLAARKLGSCVRIHLQTRMYVSFVSVSVLLYVCLKFKMRPFDYAL
jgi:hypothetical protein